MPGLRLYANSMKASVEIAIQNSSSQTETSFRVTFFPWFHWSLIILEYETLLLVSTEIYHFSGAVHSVNSSAYNYKHIWFTKSQTFHMDRIQRI